MARALRVSSRNARFQEWQALLGNRRKRRQAGEFVVQGVRPITLALEHGWPVRALIYDADRRLSRWADSVLESPAAARAERVAMAGELVRELGEKEEAAPELVAVVVHAGRRSRADPASGRASWGWRSTGRPARATSAP